MPDKIESFEEMTGGEDEVNPFGELVAAPEPTFGQKWKNYFFPSDDEARWSKPGRYEKFYDIATVPHKTAKTSLRALGSVINRGNKFLTEFSPWPETMGSIATLDPGKMKDYFPSMWRSRKAFYPVPGAAKELRTFGEATGEEWYEPLTGKKAPWWYPLMMDAAFETLLISGGAAQKASRANKAIFTNAKLAKSEITAAKRIFPTKALAKMKPAQVRTVLAKESAVVVLSKAEKAQLLKRGYNPIQIQNMTPLEAYQVMDDVPIVESAANTNLGSATKQAVDRLTAGIKRAKRLHPQKERMISQEKSRRVAVAQQIRKSQAGEKAALASRGPLKGEYSVPAFTAPEITPADRYYLFESIRTSRMPFFRYQNTSNALMKTLRGDMPTRAETALLQKHFGSGLAKAILSQRALGTKVWQTTVDILNIPRATLASWDLSFPLRQGIMLLPGHPKQWAKSFGQMMKAARPGHKGKEYARYLEDMAESNRYAGLRSRAGLDITQWGLSDVMGREEPFMSSLAELIPGVKWSNRTFTTMSNQLRVNVFDDVVRNWERAGISWASHPEEYRRLAAFLNHATGRGTIPQKLAGITPELNAFFFSPRYQISRPQVVYDAFVSLKNPAARKVIIGDLVKFVGSGMTAMFLLDQIEGVEVEMDIRHNEFGKGKVGNTRFDFWAGYAQIARLIGQVASGQAIVKGGELYNINRAETIERYVRTKLSPPAGGGWDALKGETFIGDEMSLEPSFLVRDIPKRVVPMVMQDIVEAIRFQGMDGLLPVTSTTAFFGMGVGTWEPSKWELLRREKDELAYMTHGMEWDSLNEVQQKLLSRENKLLDNLKREAAYEQTVFPFLEELKKEQMMAGLDVEAGLLKETQKEMERLKIRVGPLPRSFGDWTLNDQRYEKYKTYITKELQGTLSAAMAKDGWPKKTDEQKTMFIEKAIEIARKKARTTIRIESRKTEMPIETFEEIIK